MRFVANFKTDIAFFEILLYNDRIERREKNVKYIF